MPVLRVAIALLALASQGVLAQTAVPPTLAVQRIAPQLVAFAGSPANFQNLVNGLSQGTPVQLVTVLPGGATQVVSFTPAAPMTPLEVAQLLEATRQQLIGLGVASPSAEQLGTALVGGIVPTALGGTQLPGALGARSNPPSPAAQMQSAAAGASAPVSSVSTGGLSVQLFSASPANAPAAIPGNLSESPLPPGVTSRSVVPSASTTPPIVTPSTVPGAAAAATPPAPERAAAPARAPAAAPASPRH